MLRDWLKDLEVVRDASGLLRLSHRGRERLCEEVRYIDRDLELLFHDSSIASTLENPRRDAYLLSRVLSEALREGVGERGAIEAEPRVIPLRRLVEGAKPVEYLCEPLLPKRALVVLAGKAGVGKSFMALHIAHEVASSGAVFGRFKAEGARVLIIDEENNPTVYRQRVETMGLNPLDNIDIINFEGFKLDNHRHLALLDELLALNGYELVVMDCWTDLVAKVDENKAVDVSNILSGLRRMADKHNCTILLLHHLRKNLPYIANEIDELRGSSALVNEPEVVYLVQKDEATGHIIVKTVKNRYSGEELAFRLAFQAEGGRLSIEWAGELERSEVETDVISCARLIMNYLASVGTAKRKEILKVARDVGYSERTAGRSLNYLLGTGAAERVRRGLYRLKASNPVLPALPVYYNTQAQQAQTGACAVCGRPGGRPHATDEGVVYLHDECMGKCEGKL